MEGSPNRPWRVDEPCGERRHGLNLFADAGCSKLDELPNLAELLKETLNSTLMPVNTPKKYSRLSLLGHTAKFPEHPKAATLETFKNENAKRDYWITFECGEFTSMCPVTGQPDFAKIRIEYVPDELCIETKSLKFYLASFRNTRSFNEAIVNRILDDIVAACHPRHAMVHGEFSPRGGIGVIVDAEYPDRAANVNEPKRRKPTSRKQPRS
jgi:7-cyano-7-deazaguanine reductase